MSKARKPCNVTDSDVGDTEVMLMVMKFIELLNDEEVLRKLKLALYPQALADKLDKLTHTIAGLTSQLERRGKRITALEEKVECEKVEQYPRRYKLIFCGIPETGEGEDTTVRLRWLRSSTTKWPLPPSVSGGHYC